MPVYDTPGVYRRELPETRPPALATGIPVFAGIADAAPGGPAPAQPFAVRRADELSRFVEAGSGSFLPAAVAGFFANGGARCYVVRADPRSPDRAAALIAALDATGAVDEVDLVAVPDAAALPEEGARAVYRATVAHCTRLGDRMAILDAARGARPVDVAAHRDALVSAFAVQQDARKPDPADPAACALYYPWVKVRDGSESLRAVPPCGHVAGVYARSDARVGVFKAPANEELAGVIDLEYVLDDAIQGTLHPKGVNCVRALPGRGIRLYGARTLSRDPAFCQVNVRRLVLTLRRWIAINMRWAAFEPNELRLWVRIRRELTTHLAHLWEDGALVGTTRDEAFYVKCDAETSPPEERECGAVVTEIGLAPSVPAEFVVVRIVHREASAAAA